MIIKISLYFLAIASILWLPDRIWDKIWKVTESIYHYLKIIHAKIPFQREQKRGEELMVFLPNLEAKLAMGLKTTAGSIPQYKFYTTLLFDLLEFHQKRGISLKAILPELRLNLTKDLQFEKKLQSSMIGGNLQCFVITLTTWVFIILSSAMASIPLRFPNLLIIMTIQISGILIFNTALKRIKSKLLDGFDQAIERLYLFVSLVEIGLPISQVINESKVLEGNLMTHPLFSPCASRFMTLVNRWKENGISPKIESAEVIRDLWHLKETSFERFLKYLDMLKFIILAFFFLPAYFFHLYSIFQFFMEQ